jgi:hypothetical protein
MTSPFKYFQSDLSTPKKSYFKIISTSIDSSRRDLSIGVCGEKNMPRFLLTYFLQVPFHKVPVRAIAILPLIAARTGPESTLPSVNFFKTADATLPSMKKKRARFKITSGQSN